MIAGFFILPGAAYRKPARIELSQEGLRTADGCVPIDEIEAVEIGFLGLALSADPAIDSSSGLTGHTQLGRETGRRQAPRSYAVQLRTHGHAAPFIVAGGLTACCADALVKDLRAGLKRLA